MILTAVGEIVCFKMIFGAILRYVIFTDICGSLDFIALFSLTHKNTKKRVYMSSISVYICQYICRNQDKM